MANQVELNHKYFITLALKNKIDWSALKFIIESLTPTLEKSKEVNRFLLEELGKFHVKFQSLEKLHTGNNDKGTESKTCDTLENTEAFEDEIEDFEGWDIFDYEEDQDPDDMGWLFPKTGPGEFRHLKDKKKKKTKKNKKGKKKAKKD